MVVSVPDDVASHCEAFRGGTGLSAPHYPRSSFLPLCDRGPSWLCVTKHFMAFLNLDQLSDEI